MGQFRQISTFVEVVAKGSLSAAARAEGIAPAMIGRRLDALEARLGVKLLQRTTRKLALTDEARYFSRIASASWPSSRKPNQPWPNAAPAPPAT